VYRVKDMIGKSVVSAESGDRLGSIEDALFDEHELRLVGLVIGRGMLGGEHVLPYSDVQTVGGDTVLARTQRGLLAPREWHRSGAGATRSSGLRGRPIVTAGGRRLGEVSDLLVEETTGACTALEMSSSALGGLRSRRSILNPDGGMRVGPNAVVVPDPDAG
jgi:uncharacterized protein YrrD